MKFVYFNDTGRIVTIHPGTETECKVDMSPIKPNEERRFTLPADTYPWVKMWDYGDSGLSIFVAAKSV